MDRVEINVGLGPAAWAIGICGLVGLVVVCLTCLAIVRRPDAVESLKAFAEVIQALRKQPRIVLSGDPPDVIPKLPHAS